MLYPNKISMHQFKAVKGGLKFLVFLIAVSLMFLSSYWSLAIQDEICDNAIDDDNDGFIDLNDLDCDCIVIEPVSYIPNSSFEDISCCPTAQSELHCATGWIQASYPTTDLIHNCGWQGWNNDSDQFPPPAFSRWRRYSRF